MRLHGNRATALAVFFVLLIALLGVPCIAQAQTRPNDTAASSTPESGEDPEDQASGDGSGEASDGRSSDIEVIVVEGVRTQGLKEVPISVTHFGASDIENLRIQNVADLSAYTPNLEINTAFAASNPTLFIRGVGLKDYNSNSTGAVGIWQDGIMMNSPAAQLFSLFDVEGIEVLRGPLGGIGGRNASAGAIRIHSFKPNGEWTSDGSFTYGNLNELAFEGALGFPIFPETFGDTLSARISIVTEFRDGYTDNNCANWDPAKYGFLRPTQEKAEALYAAMKPHDRCGGATPEECQATRFEDTPPPPRPGRPDNLPKPQQGVARYVYLDLEAIAEFNTQPEAVKIVLVDAVPEDGLPAGTTQTQVGKQRVGGVFRIEPDGVCVIDAHGFVVNQLGEREIFGPPKRPRSLGDQGEYVPSGSAVPLSKYQGLQDTYNNIEYYASRVQLRWEPTDRWDFLWGYHWGENRGDSFHLQQVGVRAGNAVPGDFIKEPIGFFESVSLAGWSEISGSTVKPVGEELSFGFGECSPQPGGTCDGEKRDGLNFSLTGPGRAGADHYSGFYSSDGLEKLDLSGTSLTATFEPDWGRFVYVSGYEFSKRGIEDEGDANPDTELEALFEDEAWQITHDLRFTFEGDGYALTLGGFALHEELESRNLFRSSIRFHLDQLYTQDLDAWNLAAEVHYDFLEEGERPWLYQISLDGAMRYNWEQKEFSLGTVAISQESSVTHPLIPEQSIREIWRAWTGEATLSIKPVDNLRLYAKYTRGFKAGHYNAGLTIEPVSPNSAVKVAKQSLDAVAPEYIDALEVGLKSSWFDDRLELSGALFRYWYKDLQVFDIVNESGALPTQQLLNADADVFGAEVELTLRPIEGLMFQGGMGWLDSSFREFVIEKRVVTPTGMGRAGEVAFFDYEGNPLISAPEWSVSGYVEYELPLYRWGSIVPAFDFSYKSQVYLDPQMEELISQEAYWLYNARITYRTPGGGIEVAGWIQNIEDTEYKIDAFDESRQFNHVLEVWSEPRTYGVTVSYSF